MSIISNIISHSKRNSINISQYLGRSHIQTPIFHKKMQVRPYNTELNKTVLFKDNINSQLEDITILNSIQIEKINNLGNNVHELLIFTVVFNISILIYII